MSTVLEQAPTLAMQLDQLVQPNEIHAVDGIDYWQNRGPIDVGASSLSKLVELVSEDVKNGRRCVIDYDVNTEAGLTIVHLSPSGIWPSDVKDAAADIGKEITCVLKALPGWTITRPNIRVTKVPPQDGNNEPHLDYGLGAALVAAAPNNTRWLRDGFLLRGSSSEEVSPRGSIVSYELRKLWGSADWFSRQRAMYLMGNDTTLHYRPQPGEIEDFPNFEQEPRGFLRTGLRKL